ncbi:hypothetical protein E7811_16425 [Aliigemmobacter aestuarii]|uniref:Pilus assembly protein n=1 Tax=Aliigemmobacter aestuarii TaxID=1445661 RepID=A0A4S3MJE3_9RHOB|nr:hypothetical protein E7811_16425 [Gemmobacter aestuarii]
MLVSKFLKREDGAVTVDWFVLTASVVGLALVVVVGLSDGMETSSAQLGGDIAAAAADANPG